MFSLLSNQRVRSVIRWLRWSTICAILFYMFFIALILHSTATHKLSGLNLKKSRSHVDGVAAVHGSENERPAFATLQAHQLALQQRTHQHWPIKARKDGVSSSTRTAAAIGSAASKGQLAGEPETVIIAAGSVNERHILEKAFHRADKDSDGTLTIQELAFYINRRILDHIEEAIAHNPLEFRQVDVARADGLVSWEEYEMYFLKQHGLGPSHLDKHGDLKRDAASRAVREELVRDKARWSDAARTELFSLTIDEYLAFRHPESSISNLLELVDDLLRQFDHDGDDQLTIEEFTDVAMNDDEDLMRKSLISRTVVERRAEFKRILDKNQDGLADREELLHYVDPKTPRYALQASATLFSLGDDNRDSLLTLNELLSNAEIFLTSKMIDTANSFHTEF